jgi:hypothetical protein
MQFTQPNIAHTPPMIPSRAKGSAVIPRNNPRRNNPIIVNMYLQNTVHSQEQKTPEMLNCQESNQHA